MWCETCGKPGHLPDRCWKTYPELRNPKKNRKAQAVEDGGEDLGFIDLGVLGVLQCTPCGGAAPSTCYPPGLGKGGPAPYSNIASESRQASPIASVNPKADPPNPSIPTPGPAPENPDTFTEKKGEMPTEFLFGVIKKFTKDYKS